MELVKSAVPDPTPATGVAHSLAHAESPSVGVFDRGAWRDAATAWAGQRLLLLAIAYIGSAFVVAAPPARQHLTWSGLIGSWMSWDASLYATVATHGYNEPWVASYYPLLPALEHVLAPVTGGSATVAGLFIANLACLGSFALLRVLAERELGRAAARRALLYLVVFPTSFFLAAAYTEALFLLLTIAAFLALRRRHWVLAGACAALATLTRPVGILLLPAIAVECALRLRADRSLVRTRESVRMLLGLAMPILALAAFWLYLYRLLGTLSVALGAEQYTFWQRSITWPWVGFARAGHALLQYGLDPGFYQAHIILDALFTLAFIGLSIATIRRLPLVYVVYTWCSLAAILLTPSHNWYALASNMRFMLVVFPLFLLLARWGERRTADRAVLAISLPLLALLTLAWVAGAFVA